METPVLQRLGLVDILFPLGCETAGLEPLELDSASSMFLFGRSERRPFVIRLTAALAEPVKPHVLQAALEATAQSYPYFFVRFARRGRRLVALPVESIPRVREKDDLSRLALDGEDACEAQVTYSGHAIILEFFHGVSDGMGGLTFFLRLLAEYVSREQGVRHVLEDFPVMPLSEQMTDGYARCAAGMSVGKTDGPGSICRLATGEGPGDVTVWRLSAAEVRERARACSASVTEYLSALIALSVRDLRQQACRRSPSERIRISLPMNLRPRLSCDTMRNFTLSANATLSASDVRDVPTTCARIGSQLKAAAHRGLLAGRCSAAVTGHVLSRVLPLRARHALMQTILDNPPSESTMTFSNLGLVRLPPRMERHVASLGIAFSAKPGTPYSCAAITLGDDLRLTMVRLGSGSELERHFEQVLSAEGLGFSAMPA